MLAAKTSASPITSTGQSVPRANVTETSIDKSLTGIRIGLMMVEDYSMLIFRSGLIRQLIARGASVTLFVPPGKFIGQLEALGARVVTVPMYRFMSPFRDLVLAWTLFRVLRREKLDLLHTMTIKPNIYGALAGRAAGLKVVGLVS